MHKLFALAILFTGVALASDNPPAEPKSPPAIAAIHKADAAQKAAAEAYDQAVFKAKRTEVDELHIAMKAATQKGDLDEANAINAQLKSIETEFGKTYKPADAKTAGFIGKWKIRSADGDSLYIVTPSQVKSAHETGTAAFTGNSVLIKYPSGWTERLTFEHDRVFFENWPPGHSTDEIPRNVLVGERDTTAN